ncbi:MAG: histidine phosphatase family protein [Sulfurospirillum sp.]|nr:MAG: histidine phosphatase family protein [Sulfurospirillum sp.]
MRELFLVRHAKSSWDDPSLSDFDRPLNDRGLNDAKLIAKELKNRLVKPQIILSSPANRAKSTAIIVAQTLGVENIEFKESIYESSDFNLMMIIKELDESIKSAMIVGHNPALTMLVNKISSFSLDNLKTCGVVALTLDSWQDLSPYQAGLNFYIYPKMFR